MQSGDAPIPATVETPAPVQKIAPPRPRKGGARPGAGRKRKSLGEMLGRKKADKKTQPKTEAERIEALADDVKPGRSKPDAAFDAADPSPSRRKTKSVTMSADKFAKSLEGLYAGWAFATQQPHWKIERDEATMLANGLYDLFAEYDIDISGKSAAWVNFTGAFMIVNAPRFAAGRAMRKAKARAKAPPKAQDAPFTEPPPPAVEPILDPDFFNQPGSGGG
jgi:hypothetical protein